MPTVHLIDGRTQQWDRITIKQSGFVKCVDMTDNPNYDRHDPQSRSQYVGQEMSYAPHHVEYVEGDAEDSITHERPGGRS